MARAPVTGDGETGTELRVDSLAQGGDGVARPADGPVVFLPETAPGDLVRAALEAPRRGFRRGRLLEVLEPGPGRREPPCPETGRCGGCGWQHLTEETQAEAVDELLSSALRRIGRFDPAKLDLRPARLAGPALAYRQRARFLVDLGASPPRLGFRRRGSHAVHPVPTCAVLEPELDALRAALAELLPELARLLPKARGAELCVDLPAPGRATVQLRLEDPVGAAAREAACATLLLASPAVKTVEVTGPSGASRCGAEQVAWRRGPENDPERLPARHAPGGFLQSSRAGGEALVARALAACGEALRPGARVLELFSGSGHFTLPLAAAGARVTAVEENASALASCREALTEASLDAELVCGDTRRVLEDLIHESRSFDLVLLDPPRTGAKGECRLLPALAAPRVVSVSCDAATFARDAGLLRDAGYALTRAEPLLLFPQTPHFEIVGTLER